MMKEKKIKSSRLTAHIGYLMRVVSNNVSHSFARKLESSGVTVAEWVVLREMYGGDETTSPSIVADLTGLTRGAVSKLIERLLQKEFVTRTEAVTDRRFQEIKLTASARNLVPKLVELADENDETFFNVLPRAKRKMLTEVLKELIERNKLTKVPIE